MEKQEAPTPFYRIRSSEFVERAIAIVVNPTMVGGQKRLVCTDVSAPDRVRFEREIAGLAPEGVDSEKWARDRVDALLDVCFADDAWHSYLPNGTPVVLFKEMAIDGVMTLQDALRRVHTMEVSRAISERQDVPSAVLDEHRVFIQSMSAEREVS